MLRDPNDPMTSTYEVMTGMPGNLPTPVRIDLIDVVGRLREIDMAKVASLKASIEDIGLRTPIHVARLIRQSDDPRVRLVAGAHRLEAMRQLGREWIGAHYFDGDDLDAEIWEIDENLCRAELTPADKALFTFRRKEIYLLKNPETAQHVAGARAKHDDVASDKLSFAEATAQATGQSRRTIERDASRGEKISEKALRMLRGTRHDKGTVLDRLKSLREDEQEVYVKALFQADKERQAEAKEIRTDKLATKRAVRIDVINAIAAHGKVVAGEMPRAAYAVGYADPPWQQEAWSDETGQDKGLMYPPMPLDEIRALCAGDKSPFTPDAIVYLWVPSNRVDDGIVVLKDWGFEFVTMLTWDKEDIGMGRWVRDQTEHLLIGKRGNFPGLPEGSQPRSLYREKKTTHSRKPVWFAEMIDGLYPEMRKLELFQRKSSLAENDVRRNGMWDFWGFEAGESKAIDGEATDYPSASLLPPGPGRTSPVEFMVGGLRASNYVKFGVRIDEAGLFESSYSRWIGFAGGSGRDHLRHSSFEDALLFAMGQAEEWMAHTVRDSQSSTCSNAARAAARAGLKWMAARRKEWGLPERSWPPPQLPEAAE